jgi:phosphoadenosine phosphosulfate reductase
VAYSGGKDSQVIAHLCRLAGLKPQLIYHVTTIDPPELVRFARCQGAWFDHPGYNFARLIPQHGLPTMWRRWCCRIFKHGRTFADVTILGVRAAESYRRRKAWRSEVVPTNRGTLVLPILFWSTEELWEFIVQEHLPMCSLYSEGYDRIGCIGCPLVRRSRERDFVRWPRIAANIRDGYAQLVRVKTIPDPEGFWHRWVHDEFERPNHHAECSGVAFWGNA